MGKMSEFAIEIAEQQGVSVDEILYNKNLDEEYQYEQFLKEQTSLNAERADLGGGVNDPQAKEGGGDAS